MQGCQKEKDVPPPGAGQPSGDQCPCGARKGHVEKAELTQVLGWGGGAVPGILAVFQATCSSFQIPQVIQLRWGWGISGAPSPTGLAFVHLIPARLSVGLRTLITPLPFPSPSASPLPLSLLPPPCLGTPQFPWRKPSAQPITPGRALIPMSLAGVQVIS